jgi:hypothetical protein
VNNNYFYNVTYFVASQNHVTSTTKDSDTKGHSIGSKIPCYYSASSIRDVYLNQAVRPFWNLELKENLYLFFLFCACLIPCCCSCGCLFISIFWIVYLCKVDASTSQICCFDPFQSYQQYFEYQKVSDDKDALYF